MCSAVFPQKKTMKVTLLQHDITWANPAANRQHLDELLDAQPQSDLFVLTEMWSTGFVVQPEGIAETADGDSLRWMKEKARQRHAAIAGSLLVKDGERYYNRFYFVKSDGEVTHYDKRHLFSYGGEDQHFTRGEDRVVVEWGGVRFLLQVCYDLRFPVWSRNQNDYDAILYVANWPVPRIEVWNTLLKARAIENQCYVVGVNRVSESQPSNSSDKGGEPIQYNGSSAIIDPYGRIIAAPQLDVEQAVSADINLDKLNAFRAKFPVLNDQDRFTIHHN